MAGHGVLPIHRWVIMSASIHQNLKLEFGVSLVLGVVFLVSGMALLFWGVILVGTLVGVVHWFNSEGFQSSLVGWLVPALCFLSGWVFVHFGRHLAVVYPGWLRRANWLLGNSQPRKMLLSFPQGPEATGRTAQLRDAGKPESSPPSEIVELRSPQWKIKDLRTNPVDVFREFEPEGIVVMVASYGIIWGFRKPDALAEGHTGRSS